MNYIDFKYENLNFWTQQSITVSCTLLTLCFLFVLYSIYRKYKYMILCNILSMLQITFIFFLLVTPTFPIGICIYYKSNKRTENIYYTTILTDTNKTFEYLTDGKNILRVDHIEKIYSFDELVETKHSTAYVYKDNVWYKFTSNNPVSDSLNEHFNKQFMKAQYNKTYKEITEEDVKNWTE